MGGAIHKRTALDIAALRRLASAYASGVSHDDIRRRFHPAPGDLDRALELTGTPRRQGPVHKYPVTP